VTAWVVILEPWKGPGYIRWNTPFTVGIGGGTPARGRRVELVDHLVTVEDTCYYLVGRSRVPTRRVGGRLLSREV
jgi:hypothetical protein